MATPSDSSFSVVSNSAISSQFKENTTQEAYEKLSSLAHQIGIDDEVATTALRARNTRKQSNNNHDGSRSATPASFTSDKRRRYVVSSTPDDAELMEILRARIERQEADRQQRDGAQQSKRRRHRLRDLVFTRQFTTFDRQNPLSSESPFHGFFTLFWLAMALLLLKVAALNWKTYGSVLGRAELLHIMFGRDVIVLGLTDGVMIAVTLFGFGLQKCIQHGFLSWRRSGWIIQNLWQTFFLAAVIGWTLYRDWPWTHTLFIVLHTLIFVMKQHSYAFYNGYLSQVYRRKQILKTKLQQLEDIDFIDDDEYPVVPRVVVTSYETENSGVDNLNHRRSSLGPPTSTNLHKESSDVATVVKAIDQGKEIDEDEVAAFSYALHSELAFLTNELNGKSKDPIKRYPRNLTLANWLDWTCLPTLVYELEYPRLEKINWWYVGEKSAATLGVIWVMMVISQAYLYPAVVKTVEMKAAGMTLEERWREFPWIVSDMLFPMLLEQLLAWYVVWECVLNVLAEVTLFADRGFYGAWWNSVSWDQYARDWNRPVHNFLLRHVYNSSMSSFQLSRPAATFVTFLLSACVHELLMLCLFKKVRGYLFAMQLMQLPLVSLSRTGLLKDRKVLGNLVFWFGLFVGPSMLASLYLIV